MTSTLYEVSSDKAKPTGMSGFAGDIVIFFIRSTDLNLSSEYIGPTVDPVWRIESIAGGLENAACLNEINMIIKIINPSRIHSLVINSKQKFIMPKITQYSMIKKVKIFHERRAFTTLRKIQCSVCPEKFSNSLNF